MKGIQCGGDFYLLNGITIVKNDNSLSMDSINNILKETGGGSFSSSSVSPEKLKKETITYRILKDHNTNNSMDTLKIKFDSMASHDITYVGIIQTAKASGLTEFPLPYVLTNCHNTLAAVGGTINEDDHAFGLSAALKYGGIYVPPHQAVIHQYMREMMAASGKMILGSDSHTRYGALGTMAVGEGGPELVKQLLNRTWDLSYPEVAAVYLEGKVKNGVGPQDVALAIIGEVFKDGFVKNKVLEFVGPGIEKLSVDFRNGIDVMTTETTCLTSIWKTDNKVNDYFTLHGRSDAYTELNPGNAAYYDALIKVNLNEIDSMIALPFHPSNVFSIKEFTSNASDIFNQINKDAKVQFGNPDLETGLPEKVKAGKVYVNQGVIAGCAGGSFENLVAAADILGGKSIGAGHFSLSTYPASQPIYLDIIKQGIAEKLMTSGVVLRSAFCGPCFGAGDVPANKDFSIRHTTRNFPNREGSKPGDNQIASVALMDARSVAATALNQGLLTPATDVDYSNSGINYFFNSDVYTNRVSKNIDQGNPENELKFGPNIKNWPKMIPLPENLLLKIASVIDDPVTTTDELIPSGETSSYRSNPLRLAEFTLSRRDPEYVGRAKEICAQEIKRLSSENGSLSPEINSLISTLKNNEVTDLLHEDFLSKTGLGSIIYANKPGDGSAREQAASCQKVLGGWGNIAVEYATKRYRSNVVNWGMLPFTIDKDEADFTTENFIFIPNIKSLIGNGDTAIPAYIVSADSVKQVNLYLKNLTDTENTIISAGCLINYYAQGN